MKDSKPVIVVGPDGEAKKTATTNGRAIPSFASSNPRKSPRLLANFSRAERKRKNRWEEVTGKAGLCNFARVGDSRPNSRWGEDYDKTFLPLPFPTLPRNHT